MYPTLGIDTIELLGGLQMYIARTRKTIRQIMTLMTPKAHNAEEQSIIVVDDDPVYLTMICELLANEGYPHVYGIPSAQLNETIRRAPPALLLLDIHVASPDLNWLQLEQLIHDPDTAAIPIIICTTNPKLVLERAQHMLNQKCEILEKPFDVDDLLIRIRGRIGRPLKSQSNDPLFL